MKYCKVLSAISSSLMAAFSTFLQLSHRITCVYVCGGGLWPQARSIKKELELINSITIQFLIGAGIGIDRFGTKLIELHLKYFELNWDWN